MPQIGLQDLLALGREHPDDPAEPFNMAYLAMRGSGAINGVSRLRAGEPGRIFQSFLSPLAWARGAIGHVTNGVHVPSWDSAAADELGLLPAGRNAGEGTMETVAPDIRCVSDAALWKLRATARQALIGYARERLVQQLAASGASIAQQTQAQQVFDPNALTLGFARRFATYKRSNLLLHDPERLTHPDRPSP